MADGQAGAGPLDRLDDLLGVAEIVRDGFFAVDMLARRRDRLDMLHVVVIRGGDDDGLNFIVIQKGLEALRLAGAVALHETRSFLRGAAEAGHQLDFAAAQRGVGQHVRPASQAH